MLSICRSANSYARCSIGNLRRDQPIRVTDPISCPVVDVIIAAWNRSDTIERAVLSALAEPEVQRVIVVDDGSTDDTAARARQCDGASGRVLVRRLSSNCGPSHARNVALKLSTAPWVTVLDGDDFVLRGRYRALLSVVDDWDFIADNLFEVEVEVDKIDMAKARPVTFNGSFAPRCLNLEMFALGNVTRRGHPRRELGFLKPLMRRDFLDRHGLRYDERLRLGEDYEFYARALALGARFVIMPSRGYVSVVRSDSISGQHTREDLERLRDSNLELCKSKNLTVKERRALEQHYSSVDERIQWLAMIEGFKARNPRKFLAPLLRSPRVSLYLMRQLLLECFRRVRFKL